MSVAILMGAAFSVAIFIFPTKADASIFTLTSSVISSGKVSGNPVVSGVNSQNMPILQAIRGINLNQGRGGGDINIVNGAALMPEVGPEGTGADLNDGVANETISTYVVRKGDNLQTIAKMFDVSVNTIIWANDISGSSIKEGQVLVILPISGVEYTVKKGDTIASIAKTYKADQYDISRYNNIALSQTLAVGTTIIIPDGEISSPATKINVSTNKLRGAGGPNYDGYYLRPILGGSKSQALHGYNGIDLATYQGAPIFASAGGQVIIAARSGWNGGYGKYIVISHPNGTQTLYGHAMEVLVSVGDQVVKGQMIGLVGSTGKSTGPHLHFEVRGAKNPF